MGQLPFDDLVTVLKALSEPTRLRILRILSGTELTVGELAQVLGQSQPRVSHHLRILETAAILERIQEGTWAFYRLTETEAISELVRSLLGLMEPGPEIARDDQRLGELRALHSEQADRYFESMASRWDEIRKLYVAEERVEEAILELAGTTRIEHFLDLGTGTGRIMEIFAPKVRSGTGIDSNREMLSAARAKLARRGMSHCQFRLGDIMALEVPPASYDLVTIHHVLHFLDEPATAVAEAGKTLRPGGRIIVVDFARHGIEVLRDLHAHRRLGFEDSEVVAWLADAGIGDVRIRHLLTKADDRVETLTVTIWSGIQQRWFDSDRSRAA